MRGASIMAGRKDSSGDWSNTANLIERFPEMCIFPGSERNDAVLLESLANLDFTLD